MRLLCVCDAAKESIGTAVYVGFRKPDGSYSCSLLTAKSRISDDTIPRNELGAVLFGTELLLSVIKATRRHIESAHMFTDSKISLSWVMSDTKKLEPYVLNRVISIH